MVSRRDFLKLSAIAGVGLAFPYKLLGKGLRPQVFSHSDNLSKFITPLRMVGAPIPVAAADTVTQTWWQPGVDHYTIDIGQFTDQLHPELPHETRLWGFGQGFAEDNPHWTKHLGGVIVATRGKPVQITFRNHLPASHILPIDTTIMGADGAVNRADIHLHGGLVPWTSDGGPHAWWAPDGTHGESFLNNQVLRHGVPTAPNEAEYYYPNNQGARVLWYHDHTFGNTRINAYAGIASAYVITDEYEASLVQDHNLPGPLDPRTVYLVFQDKIFVGSYVQAKDAGWFNVVEDSQTGDLWYAHEYDPVKWELTPGKTPPAVSCIPEFFGDTILVNGAAYPYLEVEPRQYRFRILNACNARFLNPRVVYADPAHPTEPQVGIAGPVLGPGIVQIATEGGFLPRRVLLNGAAGTTLLMAPAERADIIVDFRGIAPGTTFILYNDADAPYPMGDPDNDYDVGSPETPETIPGKSPNTRTLLQFRVIPLSGPRDPEITFPDLFTPTDPFLVAQEPGVPTPIPNGVLVRYLTLNEDFDDFGRLIQKLGTTQSTSPGQYGRAYEEGTTEVVFKGDTEVWEIINLTGDTHPIHFHLVNVQVLSRQNFDFENYAGGLPTYTGDPIAPDDNEQGWKETVRMNPGQVTRVLMKFDLPEVPFTVPESPRTGGAEYVWHCHILEHEEHDMMRPLVVKNAKKFFMPEIKND
jgi:spore coat protein A